MSAIHTWACLLLWIGFSVQDKTPDVTVVCAVAEDCALPCSFQPSSNETVRWFRQDVVVYTLEGGDSGKVHTGHEHLSVYPPLVSHGNATLIIRRSGLKDRGTYRCHVTTSEREHSAKVIVKVEEHPLQQLSLELSRLSGYEEMKCTVHNVFPAPRVTWATEPRTFEELRPVTRKLSDKHGLYTVDSRLRRLNAHPDLLYICRASSSYGGPAWTTSLRVREIRGTQGRDLTLPCKAPEYLNHPHLQWSFSGGENPSRIVTYDPKSGHSTSSPAWGNHVELDKFRVEFGDGSLRLMDPRHSQHTGSFVCVFSTPHSTHTERNHVTIDKLGGEDTNKWVAGLVIAVLVLV
uniref:Ig-like domain-containing protein n=1 Tax=Tetraodon nigroviridis TaxID=99883 RepID=H3C3P2_TETNG